LVSTGIVFPSNEKPQGPRAKPEEEDQELALALAISLSETDTKQVWSLLLFYFP